LKIRKEATSKKRMYCLKKNKRNIFKRKGCEVSKITNEIASKRK
jgi:hypothetical protein